MEQLLEYIRNHILLVVILAVVLVLIIVFLVLLIVRGAQLKKAKKAAAEKAEPAPEPEPAPAPVEKAEPAPEPVEEKEPEPAPAPEPAPVEEKPAEAPAEGGAKTEEIMHGDQKIVIIKKEGSAPAPKKAAKKPAAKPAEPAAPAKPAAAPVKAAPKKAEGGAGGKWVLYEEDRGGYGFRLVAPNGEVMLRSSSPYASLSSAKSGIKTYQDNIAADRLEVVETKKGNFFVQINNASKRLLAMSADYKTRSSCESAMESIKRWAPTDSIVIETESEDK